MKLNTKTIRQNSVLFVFLIAFLFVINESTAQYLWLASSDDGNSINNLLDNSKVLKQEQEKNKLLNFNSVMNINEELNWPIPNNKLSQCQVFSVYHSSIDNNEELIWKMSDNHVDKILLTNLRMADLEQNKFVNFLDDIDLEPKINSYIHTKNNFSADNIVLGSTPINSEIPVSSFQGKLAELIIFSKVLSPVSKQIVESHLALKYSIPLTRGLDYLNANAQVIWNFKQNQNFSYRIAGIGKETALKLNQKQSQSKMGSGTLSIGIENIYPSNYLNPGQIANGTYLIWGDDNESLSYSYKYNDLAYLNRKWKINAFNFKQDQKLSIEINHKEILNNLDGLKLWMKFQDESRSLESANYYKSKEINQALIAKDIKWSSKKSQLLSLVKANDFWVDIETKNPNCALDQSGSLKANIIGGKPPYGLVLTDFDSDFILTQANNNSDFLQIESLQSGRYEISITDANLQSWSSPFFINSNDFPLFDCANVIMLSELESLNNKLKNFKDQHDKFKFEWINKQGELVALKRETIGGNVLTLKISKGNCASYKDIKFINDKKNIKNISLSPNPTATGLFQFQATLFEARPYIIEISNSTGQLVYRSEFESEQFIHFTHKIEKPGFYYISLILDNEIKTQKLAVVFP